MTQYDSQNFEAAKIVALSLLILMLINSVYGVALHKQNKIKALYQSQFTLPPETFEPPVIPHKEHCKVVVSNIQTGKACFKNKEFSKSLSVFKRVKEKAIKTKDIKPLKTAYLYLALIALEEGRNADSDIKHLFFLDPTFKIEGNKSIPFNHQKVFKSIKAQKRSLGETEVDDISGKEYIRVSACSVNCRSKIWQEQLIINEAVNHEIDCSLDGSCDYELDCSLTGTCDYELDCSIQGNCN